MDSLIGSCIGQYLIAEEIGRGGMGIVYRAVHQSVGQLAAVKVLSSHFARDESHLRRFANEARALSRVAHPGLVKIFDFGQTPRGEPYILMEYLGGELLRSRLARNRKLALPEALHIGRQAASALAAVHRNGIVHRDVKPSNMMLIDDDEAPGGERLKLLDFGIARVAGEGADLTAPGAVLGTALYMSPEQCAGESLVDGRSDVYALGVVLYELLAGRPPFNGQSAEILRMHLFQEVRPLEELAPEIPREISSLIGRMLAKPPSLRPDMIQVNEALRRDVGETRVAQAIPPEPAPPRGAGDHLDDAALRASTTRPKTPHRGNTKVARDTEAARPGTAPPPEGLQAPAPEVAGGNVNETRDGAAPTARWRQLRALAASARVMLRATPERTARQRRRLLILSALTVPAVLAIAASRMLSVSDDASSGPAPAIIHTFSGPASAIIHTSSGPASASNNASSGPVPASNSASSGPALGGNDASLGMSADMNSSSATVRLTNTVRLQGGRFRMGSTPAEIEAECRRVGPECRRDLLEREQPVREVTVSPFYIDAHETTNAEFAAWLDMNAPTLDIKEDKEYRIQRYVHERERGYLLIDLFPEYSGILLLLPERRFVPRPGYENKPVVQVTWDAASLYCKARGKRLPTEAEWEFAARGTTARTFPWGEDPPRCDDVTFGRYEKGRCERYPKGEHDVGTSPQDRTPEGVWDLGGNAAEWIQDQFLLPRYDECGECTDPVAERRGVTREEDLRIRRGGSWPAPDVLSRGATRGRWKRIEALTALGFRCASR
ncbi:SUMF1/EgtB/PvdO family nonheme iron enzyme [Sorangium sp. So ce291]|uniref:bifunctional serine/threonine-protein kinase/formylglycine-generating enzyme family protein n=1 Tax=Sorangium sp. So ce291 TaxID=3133294 RepID=UPI003F640578